MRTPVSDNFKYFCKDDLWLGCRYMNDVNEVNFKKILLYIFISYVLALVADLIVLIHGVSSAIVLLWSFLRMWSPAIATIICLHIFRDSIKAFFRNTISFSKIALKWYFLAPLIVYLALGIYALITIPLNLFNIGFYIEKTAEELVKQGVVEDIKSAQQIASSFVYILFVLAYLMGTTFNSLFALGEEIGWRGYLYNLLKKYPTYISTLVIGLVWGYWHTSATFFLGHNYLINREVGGLLLFPLLTLTTTYAYLYSVKKSNSIIPAASLHGTFNALWSLTLEVTSIPQNEKEVYLGLGILGIITWTVVSLIVYLIERIAENRY
ncbi:MAG: CPBP family glutamic-type intramembrane protease [Ignisphaera sp.]